MGGVGSGRKPDPTKQVLNSAKPKPQPQTPIGTDLYLPNYSGVSQHKKTLTDLDARYLKLDCSNDPLTSDLEIEGNIDLDGDMTLTGELNGGLTSFTGSVEYNSWNGTDTYCNCNSQTMASDFGVVMPKSGSIIGVSADFDVTGLIGLYTAARAHVKKNGSNVFSCTTDSIINLGSHKAYSTQARGIDTFDAGDRIQLSISHTIGFTSITGQAFVFVYVQFD